MANVYVQFSDSTEKEIIAFFACQQSESSYLNLGAVDTSDERWAAFYAAARGAESGLPEPTASA